MLYPPASFILESRLEHSVELIERGLDGCGDASPLTGFEGGDSDTKFKFGGLLGMEVAAAIASKDLELFVDGLDGVGC